MTNLTMLVRNRPRLTLQALQSLSGVIGNLTILDDRSDEETRELLRTKPKQQIHVIRNEIAMGTGALRNIVIYTSALNFGRGDFLYISDNDVFFKQGWLDTLIRCYEFAEKEGFRVLGAYGHPYHRPVSRRYMPDAYAIDEVTALATQSMLMRWNVYDTYGPFCETPVDKVCQSEDVDFTNKIRADGFKLGVVSPALLVSTGITNTFGERIPGWQAVAAQAPAGVIVE